MSKTRFTLIDHINEVKINLVLLDGSLNEFYPLKDAKFVADILILLQEFRSGAFKI